MSSADQKSTTPREHAPAGWDDEYSGRGGCYVVDPATGRRRPAEEPPSQEADAPKAFSKKSKGL